MILSILVIICIYSIIAISLNLSLGFTGLFNLGHAAFMGIGAYASALLAIAGVPFWISILLGAALAGLFGMLLGAGTLGLRGDYLCIVTVGFGEIARAVFKNWTGVTRGAMGVPGIPSPSFFGFQINMPGSYLVLSLVFLILCYLFTEKLVRSPFGRILRCIREDQLGTESLGKDVRGFKIAALTIGSAWCGLGGALYAHYVTFIDPTCFTMNQTVLFMLCVIAGGMGNNAGVVAATAIIVIARESARMLGLPPAISAPIQQIVYSLLLFAIIMLRPNGLFSKVGSKGKAKPVKPKGAENAC